MSAAPLLTTLPAIPLFHLSFALIAAAAVVNNNYGATVATTTSFPLSFAHTATNAELTSTAIEPAAMSQNDRKLLQRSGRSPRMQWSLVHGEVAPVGYYRRRQKTDMFREVIGDRREAAPLAAVRTRRSLNIFGHDGGDTKRQTVAMLYSVADRRFVQIGKNGSAMTEDRQESIHGY